MNCFLASYAIPHSPAALPWPLLEITGALAALVLLPGYALVLGLVTCPGRAWLASGWALGLGVTWNALLILLWGALGFPLRTLVVWSPLASLVLWFIVLRARTLRTLSSAIPRVTRSASFAALATIAAAALAFTYTARTGTPITYYSDSPDHIATIRRIISTGDPFPLNAYYDPLSFSGHDLRKGLWHPQVALLSILTHLDPYDAWRLLAAPLAALFVLNAAAFGYLIGGPSAAAIAAWALLLTYGGSLTSPALRQAVFATRLSDQLSMATIIAVLQDIRRPAAGTRWCSALLAMAAVFTHVFGAIYLAVVLGGLGLGLLIRDRHISGTVRRLSGTAALMALACTPYLVWRVAQSSGPLNAIHAQPQGLLTLWDSVRVVMPGVLWEWMGVLWFLIPLAWIPLWRHARDDPASLSLLTTSAGVALIIFNPIAIALLQPRLGYLLMRLVWMIPLHGFLAWAILFLFKMAQRPSASRRIWWAASALVAALLGSVLVPSAEALFHPARVEADEAVASPNRWRPALTWLEKNLPSGLVILSDPATSYCIPMLTSNYVVALLDQHGPPNDTHGVRRILDARDALDPYSSWSRSRSVLERYGVDLIVLNGQFAEVPRLIYWNPSLEWYRAERSRLGQAPKVFELLRDDADFAIYRVHRESLTSLAGERTRPFVEPYRGLPALPLEQAAKDLPGLLSLELERHRAAPGDTLLGVARWCSARPALPGAYSVTLRFDRPLPRGLEPPAWCSKPVRKIIERLTARLYRFRCDHVPVRGLYGVDLWRPSEVVNDTFALAIPLHAAPGEYAVRIKIVRQIPYLNLRLADYFSDEDYLAGPRAGQLQIVGQASP